jgi:single-stranded-DNA-specific exonuclease
MYEGISAEEADTFRQALRQKGLKLTLNQVKLLWGRGLRSVEKIVPYLEHPTVFTTSDFPDPFLLPDMDKAVKRIQAATISKEKLLIFGDYDCDGIISIAILHLFFRTYFPDVAVYAYQPSRFKEGYGFNNEGIKEAEKHGCSLIVTVDCGVSDVATVEEARRRGIDVIVTDHHEPPEVLPEAIAILDPKREDFPYPFKSFAGAGVAFLLVLALARSDPKISGRFKMAPYLELAAIATVGDIVPLVEDNRRIVQAGFAILDRVISGTKGMNLGIRHIRRKAGELESPVNSKALSHGIVPRLNAAGRIDDARISTRLVITEDEEEAEKLASQLEEMNSKRKKNQNDLGAKIEEDIRNSLGLASRRIIIYSGEGIDEGIRGIVAGRIVERFHKPAFIFTLDRESGLAVGSVRSVESVNIHALMKELEAENYYVKWGGHAGAAGLSVSLEKFPEFLQRLEALAQERISSDQLVPVLTVAAPLSLEEANPAYGLFLKKMEPFGQGNEEPLFLLEDVRISAVYENSYYDKNDNRERMFLKIVVVSSDDLFRNAVTLWHPEVFFGVDAPEKIDKKGLIGQKVDMVVKASVQENAGQTYFNMNLLDMDIR